MAYMSAIAVFFAVVVFVISLSGSEGRARVRLNMLLREGAGPQARAEPVTSRLLVPVLQTLTQQFARLMPTGAMEGMRQRLIVAGEPMTVQTFLTFRLVIFALFLGLPVMVIATGGVHMGLMAIMALIGGAAMGALLPVLWLRQRVGMRQMQIIKSLPDAFDLITTCVEAGLGLDAALARVAEKSEGPFADELSRALRDISLGKLRRDALKELGERTGVSDLVSFVNSVIQAEQMGSSIGTVLRVQAEQLRVRRRQRAEEQAYKAPVKMIFPLVLCIFPTLFIVILGPAVITVMKGFPK